MDERERLIELIEEMAFSRFMTSEERRRLADHLLANGVIAPPCKVGDEVWVVFTPKYPANPADKGKWFMKQDGVQRIIYGAKRLSIETWNMGTIPAKEIGKKLFISREEAEKALKERSEGE